jgi:hypothetical protein
MDALDSIVSHDAPPAVSPPKLIRYSGLAPLPAGMLAVSCASVPWTVSYKRKRRRKQPRGETRF